jgi:HSP20 family protein
MVMRRSAQRGLPDLLDWAESLPQLLALTNRPVTTDVRGMRLEEFVEDGRYVVRAELPGMDPENDIDIEVDDGVMTIRAERRQEKHDRGSTEFYYGRLERRVVLPEGADESDITARYEGGVLEVSVAVREKMARPRSIPVQRSASGGQTAGGQTAGDQTAGDQTAGTQPSTGAQSAEAQAQAQAQAGRTTETQSGRPEQYGRTEGRTGGTDSPAT